MREKVADEGDLMEEQSESGDKRAGRKKNGEI